MNNLTFPPKDKQKVISGEELAKKLEILVGTSFPLTDKPRTNGAELRKRITNVLDDGRVSVAEESEYTIIPPKGKGIPRMLACLADSYIVTTGDSYNLQVWNRFPFSDNVLIEYHNSKDTIVSKEIRFIFAHVDSESRTIKSIIVATPEYIVKKFGVFGVPTMKHQLIISDGKRTKIMKSPEKCLFFQDTSRMSSHTTDTFGKQHHKLSDAPKSGSILSLDVIKEKVLSDLIGKRLELTDTKNRGQSLERIVAGLLGYQVDETMVGGYPDIPNQLLEVKTQDSPTVDLGKYSPNNPIVINESLNFTTEDVRYLIALTSTDGTIEGVILAPGEKLGSCFTFVADTSFKCQRAIPMSFFESQSGKSVFNPKRPKA